MKNMLIFFCLLLLALSDCFGARIWSDQLDITADQAAGTPAATDKVLRLGADASLNAGCIEYVYATPVIRMSQDCSDYFTLLAITGALGVRGTTTNGTTNIINLQDSAGDEQFSVDTNGNAESQGNMVVGGVLDVNTGESFTSILGTGVGLKHTTLVNPTSGLSALWIQSDDQMYYNNFLGFPQIFLKERVDTVTGNTTLNANHSTVLVDPSAITSITLPAAADNDYRNYTIKVLDLDYAVSIDANLSETIDGELTYSFTYPGESITITSDGTNWKIKTSNKDPQQYISGSLLPQFYSTAIDYTVLDGDNYGNISVTAVNKTITLPTAADNSGRSITVVKSIQGGTTTVDGEGSETISHNGDALTSVLLDFDTEYLTVVSNGSGWIVTGHGNDWKWYDLTVTNSNPTNWTTRFAKGKIYKQSGSTDQWFIEMIVQGDYAPQPTQTGATFTISNITTKATGGEPFACAFMTDFSPGLSGHTVQVVQNSNTVIFYHASTSVFGYAFNCTVPLGSKPTSIVK